ncbi:Hypothetical protein A7982_00128 [Minicystis rosea]|nr:Hypothetical protein A7982_00128 [Minicystis rosea]
MIEPMNRRRCDDGPEKRFHRVAGPIALAIHKASHRRCPD